MITWAIEEATAELRAGEAPEGLLSRAELVLLSSLRRDHQRADWLLGRSVVKKLCRAELHRQGVDARLSDLFVVPGPDGTPVVLGPAGQPLLVTVAVSHRAGLAAAALCEGLAAPLGVEVELVERSCRLDAEAFTAGEAACIAAARPWDRLRVETEIRALEGAASRALRLGQSAGSRVVEVRPRGERRPGWAPARVLGRSPATALVRDVGGFVLALVWLGSDDAARRVEQVELRHH